MCNLYRLQTAQAAMRAFANAMRDKAGNLQPSLDVAPDRVAPVVITWEDDGSGSSYYDLPIVLNWFAANIGVHHVHHLSSRIPYYRVQEVLHDFPELREHSRSLLQSLGCVNLALWDEAGQRLISFKELRQRT